MKVERFFHLRQPCTTHGGATIRVVGDTEHPQQVEVQAAICSRRDPYSKKIGRALTFYRTPKVVPLRFLPQEIKRIAQRAAEVTHTPDFFPLSLDYSYAVRYFLPKE